MQNDKPFASLSSGLLARRGEAKPAMRRQAIDMSHTVNFHALEDLGWNDMGEEVPPAKPASLTGLTPVPHTPTVVEQQRELEREFASPETFAPEAFAPVVATPTKTQRTPRAAPGSKGKAAFTLRLDPDRHLKLRLVCAVNHRSAQQIVTQALDEFLARQPSVAGVSGTVGQAD